MGSESSDDESRGGMPKVERVIDKYGLDGLGATLERRWLGDGREQASTRELAEDFNREVLQAAIDDSETFTLSGDVVGVYQTLTDEDDPDRALVRSRLEQNGVDVSAVTGDFVSHQTIYRYLRNHRGAERADPTDTERTEKAIETVQRLQGRTETVTAETIDRLRRDGSVTIGEFDVFTDVRILCEECGRSYDVATLLDEGGCECDSTS